MKKLYESFITSVTAQLSANSLSYSRFITEETYIGGQPFSFAGHEFQEYCTKLIEDNPGCTFAIMKPSQIGMSEWIYRVILARMAVIPGTCVILSMPTITFSNEVFKTRISNVISQSPVLNNLIDRDNDSASVKAFYNTSILYALAGNEQSKSVLLNRPAQWIVIDETDRQNRQVYTGYTSRQGHQKEEDCCVIMISTPTISDFGIDQEVKECGVVHEPLVKCSCCGHEFLPDYYEDIVIPGYTKSLTLLTKENIAGVDVDSAYIRCPECKEDADSFGRQIIWKVTYNEKWPKTNIGVKLNPWVANSFMPLPKLIRFSTKYTSQTEWLNQGLGRTALVSDSSLSRKSFIFNHTTEEQKGIHVFGLDMGKICSWMHGVQRPDTSIRVIETATPQLSDLEEFLEEQHKKYNFICGVMDQQPYTDMAYKLVQKYHRLYSCIYIDPLTPIPELFKLKLHDKHEQLVRQAALNKTLGFDTFLGMLEDFVEFQTSELDATILLHFLSLRRVRDFTRGDDLHYKWVKTARDDHFAHAYIYMMLATKLAYAGVYAGSAVPIVIKKMNIEEAKRRLRR